ncbi:hypothetical protein [Aurantiacibacter odishensis]|uniref:hypothetical protein n=1 Tax=Aurantiacibacter odishensis TaxID=1155476 RepID=UPI000E7228BC|nr:hypothetical protein [Aurantiacibacter odishensis]
MIRPLLPSLSAILLLSGCGQPAVDGQDDEITTADLEGQPGNPVPDPPRPDGAQDEPNDGYPDMSPPRLTPEAERAETGARSVLLNWARAIELEEFDQAWAMLSESDGAKWSRTDFASQFAGLDEITVSVPSGKMEGAAGSSYYTAPVTITANDTEGRPVRYEGEAVLRRVNDVPAQLPNSCAGTSKRSGWTGRTDPARDWLLRADVLVQEGEVGF